MLNMFMGKFLFIDHKIAFQAGGNCNHFRNEETKASRGNSDLLKITLQNIHSTVKYCLPNCGPSVQF